VPPEVARPEQVEGMLDDFVALVGERAQAL